MAAIEIQGIDELFRKLDSAAAISTLRPPVRRAIKKLKMRMAVYPPPIPGSKYIRGTGWAGRMTSERLGQNWTTKIDETTSGLVGKVGNNTSYGPWVQSSAFQARVHKGRWQTDADVADREQSGIVSDFEQTIQEALDK